MCGENMKSIIELWIKSKTLRTIWILWLLLSGTVLSLSQKNPVFSYVSSLPKQWLYKTLIELLLLSLVLLLSLIILHKKRKLEINFQTCDWISDPGVWKHKTTGVLFCQKCHSPLSSELYCATCERGYGKGEVFTVDW